METLLHTDRLTLVPITRELVEAVLEADPRIGRETAEKIVGAKFPDLWPGRALVERAFSCPIEKIRREPDAWLWGARVLVSKNDNVVVGSVILNGRPEHGVVEVAYGVDEAWQGRGFATEGTRAVVTWALDQRDVARVQACTFPWHMASQKVLERIGMHKIGVRETDMFGDLLLYERGRAS